MTAAAPIIAALNQAIGSASSKAFLAAIAEGEGGTTFNILYGSTMWTGSMAAFPLWSGVLVGNGWETHAAGAFQFEPASYADAVKISGRPAFEPQDQIQNAWDYANLIFGERYKAASLHAVLQAGGSSSLLLIPAYLGKIWIGGADSGFPKRFMNNLPLVSASAAPSEISLLDAAHLTAT
jgi:hypothetical protein